MKFVIFFIYFTLKLWSSLIEAFPVSETSTEEWLEPRDIMYDFTLGFLGSNDDHENQNEHSPSHRFIKIPSKITNDVEIEPVGDVLEILKEQANEANDEEQRNSMLDLVQNLNNVLFYNPARYAKIFVRNAWHNIDLGPFNSMERTRNAMSTEDFLSRLKRIFLDFLKLCLHFFSEDPSQKKAKDEDKQDSSVPMSKSTSEHQTSEKSASKSDVPVTPKPSDTDSSNSSHEHHRLEMPSSERSPSHHDHPPTIDSKSSELLSEQRLRASTPGHSEERQHRSSEMVERPVTKLEPLPSPSSPLEPKPAEQGVVSGSTTEEMFRRSSVSHQVGSESGVNKHEIGA